MITTVHTNSPEPVCRCRYRLFDGSGVWILMAKRFSGREDGELKVAIFRSCKERILEDRMARVLLLD